MLCFMTNVSRNSHDHVMVIMKHQVDAMTQHDYHVCDWLSARPILTLAFAQIPVDVTIIWIFQYGWKIMHSTRAFFYVYLPIA